MQNNQIIKDDSINDIKDDSSSRDKYYNDHVACIVFGNKEFKEKHEKNSKEENKTIDELVGTDFLFGKYLNFETNEKEWQQQLKELTAKLNDPKFANLKGIKFFLDEHGEDGNNRNLTGYLAAKPSYYKSKRFQQVAKIINDCFLDKNQDNKLYFVNKACYGAYFFNELKKNVGNDIPRSNNIYEILSNEFGLNRNKVYCSQLIPQSGINATCTLNSSCNPYRNRISYSTQIGNRERENEKHCYNSGPHDFCKKYYLTYHKLFVNEDLIPSPECRIYFPLEKFRDVAPNYHTKPITKKDNQQYVDQEKYYKVDDKILEFYTGKKAKSRKNNFLKWGEQPKYVKIDEKSPIVINGVKYNNLSEYAKKNLHDYNQQCHKQFKQSQKESRRQYEKDQAITKSGYSLLDNQDRILDCHIF